MAAFEEEVGFQEGAMPFFRPKSEFIQAYDASVEHIESVPGLSQGIDDRMWSIRHLLNLIPYPVEALFSGHNFPLIEAQQDIDDSYGLALSGFYKSAILSLRGALELGLLSIFWDRNDSASKEIKNWLASKERTPQLKTILDGILKIKGFPSYGQHEDLKQRIIELHDDLSKYSHTRGVKNSSYSLRHGNVHRFNTGSFGKWYGLFDRVCQAICIVHLLKYPVGLQYTPVEDKYGIDGPMGFFLEPHQADRGQVLD